MRAQHFVAAIIVIGGEGDGLVRAVDALQPPLEKAVAPARAVTAIADLVEIGVKRSGGHFVEERLPDMREVLIDEDDVVRAAPVFRAEPPDQFQPSRAAANDDDLCLAPVAATGWCGKARV